MNHVARSLSRREFFVASGVHVLVAVPVQAANASSTIVPEAARTALNQLIAGNATSTKQAAELRGKRVRKNVGLMRRISGRTSPTVGGEFQKPPRNVFRYSLERSEKRSIFLRFGKRMSIWNNSPRN
jgi:hypothetical protein